MRRKRIKDYLDSCIPRAAVLGMPQSGLTTFLASGKVQEEIKTPTWRKEDSKLKSTVFKI